MTFTPKLSKTTVLPIYWKLLKVNRIFCSPTEISRKIKVAKQAERTKATLSMLEKKNLGGLCPMSEPD